MGAHVQGTDLPDALERLARGAIAADIYPAERFPRAWFPGLEDIVIDVLRDEWRRDPDLRRTWPAADPARAEECLAPRIGLPALLSRHPHSLLLMYRHMISAFARRLLRGAEESRDIAQEVSVRLLAGKLDRIRERYNNQFGPVPSFTSYFMVCVRNMVVDILRARGVDTVRSGAAEAIFRETAAVSRGDAGRAALLEEEFARLRAILSLHPAGRPKIILGLKLKCRATVTADDVRRCFPGCSEEDIRGLTADFRRTRDGEMYRRVTPIFNRHEPEAVQADSLRKWVENRARLMVGHLNRLQGTSVYDNDSLCDLLGLFFAGENTHG